MTRFNQTAYRLTATAISMALAGCGTHEPYRDEAFRSNTPFSKRISAPGEIACDSVKRALLNQGYSLEPVTASDTLIGTKAFQREKQTVTLRLQTTCMDNNDGSHTVFANAQQETSELQPLKQPAGITIGPIGGITVPTGSAQFPVMVERETIQDADFYTRFFRHVQELVDQARRR